VAGHPPDRIGAGAPGVPARYRDALVAQVALTPAMAAKFAVHVGSFMELAAPNFGHPVYLQITGLVAPRPGQFWHSTQVVATPKPRAVRGPGQGHALAGLPGQRPG
jgi:hypothetical protein